MSVVNNYKMLSKESFFYKILTNSLPFCLDPHPSSNRGESVTFCVVNNGLFSFIIVGLQAWSVLQLIVNSHKEAASCNVSQTEYPHGSIHLVNISLETLAS